jgi:hypothetical protein
LDSSLYHLHLLLLEEGLLRLHLSHQIPLVVSWLFFLLIFVDYCRAHLMNLSRAF